VFSAFTYIIVVHCQTRFDLLFSVVYFVSCVTYSVLWKLSWKDMEMDINGSGKSWKTHIKRSWKVMENCSVLYSPWSQKQPQWCWWCLLRFAIAIDISAGTDMSLSSWRLSVHMSEWTNACIYIAPVKQRPHRCWQLTNESTSSNEVHSSVGRLFHAK